MNAKPPSQTFSATPAGICEAARAGDLAAIDRILADKPNLIAIDNPHNWTKLSEGHATRGSYNKKPVEVAAFFNQGQAVAKILQISRYCDEIKNRFDDLLPFHGHFNALGIARAMQHASVIQVIEAEIWTRLEIEPERLDAADGDGRTVLHYAAEQGHVSLVRKLLERGANPDTSQRSGRRPIHIVLDGSASEEARDVANLLVAKGANYDLWIAVALDDIVRARELLAADASLAKKHFRPDAAKRSGGFPLVRACANGNREMVELLLESGADINAKLVGDQPAEFGMPIIAAAYAKHYDIVNLLLDRGASVAAHPNCAAPFVDMLYYTAAEDLDWLALGELRFATEDARSHLQPSAGQDGELLNLYQRVLAAGGEPQAYSHIRAKNYVEIERLLKESPNAMARNPERLDSVYRCFSHAAAWLGDAKTMNYCLLLQPQLHSVELANENLKAAIRSHNREGSFADYRQIIEANLRYLKEQQAEITVRPLFLLAKDFLENYSYGTHPQLPTMNDLVNLANLFLDYGVDINQRHTKNGPTALTQAVNEGHASYVEFLIANGAEIHKDDPPNSNPVLLARKHGFTEILRLLGETPGRWGEVVPSDLVEIESPTAGNPPLFTVPLSNAVIRLGVATIDRTFQPKGQADDTRTHFVEFPEPFPAEEFSNVRLILTNRIAPQIVGSATTGISSGRQGFLLKAQNSYSTSVEGASFSWMAVLPTGQKQKRQFDVRFGLLPFREYKSFPNPIAFTIPDTAELYADEPLTDATSEKYVFLTTTVSGCANPAAEFADENGIPIVHGHQTVHRDGGVRVHWMVIAERESTTSAASGPPSNALASPYFESEQLWIQTGRAEPGTKSDWEDYRANFLAPFRERSPCVFVSSNRHGVAGHHASVVAMSWACRRGGFVIKSRSFDPLIGQSNFDYLAIGHCDTPVDEVAAINQNGPASVDKWDRFNDWNGYELAASEVIGVNEFGNHGGSLLMHATYERYDAFGVRRLLAIGADANQKQPGTNLTPLHIAAAFGRLKVAHLLIEHGANVNATTLSDTEWRFPPRWRLKEESCPPFRAETPLHLAILNRKYDIALLLLKAGANPNAEDSNGDRPIDYLPEWSTYPDSKLHWQLINRRTEASKEDYETIIAWIRKQH